MCNMLYKRKYIPKKKRTEKQNVDAELWRVFSLWIRQRDTDENGYVKCISCGRIIHWREGGNCHAGHFYSQGGYKSVKYHEKNVHCQCFNCNMNLEGNKQGYALGLEERYGKGILDELLICKNNKSKLFLNEKKLLIKDYIRRLEEAGYETV